MTEAERNKQKLALAHRLIEAVQTSTWREVLLPYLEQERAVTMDLMASMTDSLQLMRYAGSMQTLNSLIGLEARARQAVDEGLSRKVQKFS